MTGELMLITLFQLFLVAIIIYTFYYQDKRLAFFLLAFILIITIWKQYYIMQFPSLCRMSEKLYC